MRFLLGIGCVFAVAAWASPAGAVTILNGVDLLANFDGGNSASVPDGYRGSTGNGWGYAWETEVIATNSGAKPVSVVAVRSVDELPPDPPYEDAYSPLDAGSGNYLYVDADLQADDFGWTTVGRKCTGKLGIDLASTYTISFLFRVDESADDLAANFATGNDRYQLYDYPSLVAGSRSGVGWFINAQGDHSAGSKTWLFYDGLGRTGSTGTNYVNTGLSLISGDTYRFEVTVHPEADAKSWDGTVTNLRTSQTHTSTNLGWRIDTTAATGNPDAVLSGLTQICARGSDSYDRRQFALDSLRIQQTRTFTIGGMYEVAARFNAGETTEAVDGFTGMAGGGWNTPWTERNDRATLAATVKDAFSGAELHAGTGNYLEMTATTGEVGTTGYSVGGISRDYQRINEAGIDWTKEHTIRFTVRMDEDVNSLFNMTFTDAHDRYDIFDSPYNRGGINAETSWGAYVKGDGEHEWQFINGGATAADSNILVTMGGVYDFTITVKPETGKYDVTLTDGSATFNVTDLAWNTTNDYVGGVLCFMARGNVAGDVRAWSIDEILITQEAPAIPGDTNGDGYVDADDAATLASHWGQIGVTQKAAYGDFNEDGAVNAADASILAANWNPRSTEGTGALPEPGAILLVVVGGLTLAARRRR